MALSNTILWIIKENVDELFVANNVMLTFQNRETLERTVYLIRDEVSMFSIALSLILISQLNNLKWMANQEGWISCIQDGKYTLFLLSKWIKEILVGRFYEKLLLKVRELDGKMENLSLEVKDFEGAVKLQGAMMDKLSATRAGDGEGKEKEKKMTETQRAMLEAKIMQV